MSNADDTAKPEAQAADAPPSSPPADMPSQVPASRSAALQNRLGVVLALVLFLVLGAVIASHWPAFTGTQPDNGGNSQARGERTPAANSGETEAQLRNDVANLRARLQQAEARTAPAERTAQAAPGTVNAFGDLAGRIGGVDVRVGLIENQLTHTADKDVQAALQDRVARLESDSSGAALHRAASVLAVATLARATQNSGPFKTELDALAAIDPADPALVALTPFAGNGVPTLGLLRARFPEVARSALDAERAAASGNDVLSRLWTSLRGLISVRRVGAVAGNTNADRLARAEDDLNRGELAAATMEAGALTGAAANAADAWLKDAQARIAVDRALAEMDSRIVQALAAQPAAPDPPQAPAPRLGANPGRRP